MQKIRILLCGEDATFQAKLSTGLQQDAWLHILAHVSPQTTPLPLSLIYQADVLVATPLAYNHIDTLLPRASLPVILVHGEHDKPAYVHHTAIDAVQRPVLNTPQHLHIMMRELSAKIKLAAPTPSTRGLCRPEPNTKAKPMMIAIGASTGGTEALLTLLSALPPTMPGILVVQHMPAAFTQVFAQRLNTHCALTAKEAKTGDEILPGHVYIAPGGMHMEVQGSAPTHRLRCLSGNPVKGHCPSVDILMASVAQHIGRHALGILLTGMGRDGAEGMHTIRAAGGTTLAQDKATSVVYGMPKAAYERGAVDHVLGLPLIAPFIQDCVDRHRRLSSS